MRPLTRPAKAHFAKAFPLILVLLLAACSATAQVPPPLDSLSDEWQRVGEPRAEYVTPAGDSALVLQGGYIRARFEDVTYVACTEQGAPLFSLQGLAATADSVLRHGAPYGGASLWTARAECITTFRAVKDSLE